MCGRYYRRSDKQRIAECFAAHPTSDLTDLVPDYNVAPTTFQPVIDILFVDLKSGQHQGPRRSLKTKRPTSEFQFVRGAF